MDVDAPRLVRRRIERLEGAPHDHRRRNERRRSHEEQAGQGDSQQCKRGHEQRLGAGELALRRRDDLHIAGVGIDPLQPRRGLARIVLEQLPAEPGLADLVEAAADGGEFGRHGAFAERMSLPVADQEPEIGGLAAQLFQLGRRPQDQVALRVASERALDDIDHAIFVAPGDHEPRHAQRPDDDGNERREQHRLERQQAPAQPRAQAIGFVVLAHGSFFKR